ncbi:hypothetical protein X733_33515 [Mesorhizobium sp. L2C067A000]|nr:hypothetical protein X733_33515 [Mesorhizobium sp. L2C067A000]
MAFAQIPFLAGDELDVLGDKIDAVSQLNQFRIWCASKTRIDFNDDWTTLCPP